MAFHRPVGRISSVLAAVVLVLLFASANAQAQALSLTTAFNSNNQYAGNSFDVEVLKPGGVEVESMDVNVVDAGNSGQIEVWTRPGTSVGFEGSVAGWTSQGSFTVTSAGQDLPTPVPVSFSLPQGEHGVVVGVADYPSLFMRYTNGGPRVFQDPELKLTTQNGQADPVLGGGVVAGRQWNGTIHYSQMTAECKSLESALNSANNELTAANDALSAANAARSHAPTRPNARARERARRLAESAREA